MSSQQSRKKLGRGWSRKHRVQNFEVRWEGSNVLEAPERSIARLALVKDYNRYQIQSGFKKKMKKKEKKKKKKKRKKKKNEDSNMNNLSRNCLRNKEDRIRVSLRFTLSLNLPNCSYS